MRPVYTLAVVATEDGFIARHPGHSPAEWASAEEQALFRFEVANADWGIMGRGTHEAADRPDRRRIVFSSAASEPHWRRPQQLWLNPAGLTPSDLPRLVAQVHPLRHGLILGGTRVHDWFHAAGRIDRVHLTVEPVRFGAGLPVFTGAAGPPLASFQNRGYRPVEERALNDRGTHWYALGCDEARPSSAGSCD